MRGLVWQRQAADALGIFLEPAEMLVEQALGIFVYDRTDIGREVTWVADLKRFHRTRNHTNHPVGDIVLDKNHAAGRAALAGALKGRGDDVAGDLLSERR